MKTELRGFHGAQLVGREHVAFIPVDKVYFPSIGVAVILAHNDTWRLQSRHFFMQGLYPVRIHTKNFVANFEFPFLTAEFFVYLPMTPLACFIYKRDGIYFFELVFRLHAEQHLGSMVSTYLRCSSG